MRVCSASTAACSPTRRSVLDVSSLLSADAVIVAWGQSATIVAMPLRVRYKKNLIIDIFIKNKLIFLVFKRVSQCTCILVMCL